MRPLLFALLLLGSARPAEAIVIRHDVPDAAYLALESDYPALFALYRTRAGHRDCMATLIGRRWAVTAAHCTQDAPFVAATREGASGYRIEIAGREAFVDRVYRGEGAGAADIALLRLREPVDHVTPLPLHRRGDELGRIVALPGWGGTGNGETGAALADGRFRVAENRVDRADEIHLYWTFEGPEAGERALTLEGISGPGDSGGPALVRHDGEWAVIGISSSQRTGGRPEGSYGVEEAYVRLSAFAEWIDSIVGEQEADRSASLNPATAR